MVDSSTQNIVDILLKELPKECNIYLYGSRVYGTHDENSDHDFVIIYQSQYMHEAHFDKLFGAIEELKASQNADFHLFPHVNAFYHLGQCHPMLIETLHLPEEFKFRETFQFNIAPGAEWQLDKSVLRQSFSRTASNSWVKAKKKLTVEKDYDERVARKSLFHSFRLLDLAIQISNGVQNPNFSSSNDILKELNNLPAQWDIWDATFRDRHNALQTKFREVCPKL